MEVLLVSPQGGRGRLQKGGNASGWGTVRVPYAVKGPMVMLGVAMARGRQQSANTAMMVSEAAASTECQRRPCIPALRTGRAGAGMAQRELLLSWNEVRPRPHSPPMRNASPVVAAGR